jgi:hypothetical protein
VTWRRVTCRRVTSCASAAGFALIYLEGHGGRFARPHAPVNKTRRLTKRRREQPTTELHPVELATLVEASAAPVASASSSSDAETVEMVPLVEIERATRAAPAANPRNAPTEPLPAVVREDAETEEIIELAKGSSKLPPPIVTARGPRRSRSRMPKIER